MYYLELSPPEERELTWACPQCIYVCTITWKKKQGQSGTLRSRLRQSITQHFYTGHPSAGLRKRSLIMDKICQELGV